MDLKMRDNAYNYRNTLDRISAKYSKLSRQGEAVEVNWEHEKLSDVERLISEAELEISRIETESPLIGSEYSDGNTKNYSQIEYPAKETHYSTEINDTMMDGASEMEETQASGMDLMDDSQGDPMDGLMQPEDQDEDLEQTLSSNGSTLMELYPQMISKIEKARHRQQISEAASSVLRRYRRMRQTEGNARKTTVPKPTPKGENHHHLSRSCVKHQPKAEVESSPAVFHSPARRPPNTPESLQGWRGHPERPVRSHEKPVLVMDFYAFKPASPASMNQTFTVAKGSPPCSPLSGTPRRRSFSPAVQSHAQTLRLNRSNLPHVMESSCVPNSPVRPQALFKTKWRDRDSYGGSRDTFPRHSNAAYLEGYTREAEQASHYPASPSALHKHQPCSPKRRLYRQDCPSPSWVRMDSPRLSSATCLRFPRHNSFDSSLRPGCVTRSPAKIEEEFTNLYHKYVCLGKSPLSDLFPCTCGVGRSKTNRGSSSSSASALSALALSPYRSLPQKRSSASTSALSTLVLSPNRSVPQKRSSALALSALALSPYHSAPQKRARELDHIRSPTSKRPREWASSPGSLRDRKESRRSLWFSSRGPISY